MMRKATGRCRRESAKPRIGALTPRCH